MGQEKVIAVMGVTGAGKSSFIKLVTGDESIKIGTNLTSETSVITSYKFRHRDRTIVLVDTPGFDDTQRKDTDVLKVLTAWFEGTYRSGIKLCGIIYLHRITDDRMRGSSMRSLRMFRSLCGESFYRNLLLGTTCWSLIDENLGTKKETELMRDSTFWKGFIAKGAQFARIPDDGFDAKELVYDLARMEPATLQVQHEMVDRHISFDALSATQTLDGGMAKLKAEQEAEMRRAKLENEQRLEAQRRAEEELRARLEEENRFHALSLRVMAQRGAIDESKAKYSEGLQNSTYLAKMHPLTTGFSTTCDGCCSWVGLNPYYVCQDPGCFEGTFTLCHACYRGGTVFCRSKSHHAGMRMWTAVHDSPPKCRLSRAAVAASASLACYRCGEDIDGVFAHCCMCLDDGFNMCLDCLTKLGTCKKSWSLSGHRLWPVIRRVPKQAGAAAASSSEATARAQFERAKALQDDDKYAEAIPLYVSVLSQREPHFPPEDQLVRDANYSLGICLKMTNSFADALPRLHKAYEGEQKAFGADDLRTLYTAFEVGRAYQGAGRLAEAEPYFLAAAKRASTEGAKDFPARTARYSLGDIFAQRRDFAAAADMYALSLQGEVEAQGPDHADTLHASFNLAKMRSFLQQWDQSIEMYARTVAVAEKCEGPDGDAALKARFNLALVYEHMGEPARAAGEFHLAAEGYARSKGPGDEETVGAIKKKAECLAKAGYESSAEGVYRTALERGRASLGEGHELMVEITRKLAEL